MKITLGIVGVLTWATALAAQVAQVSVQVPRVSALSGQPEHAIVRSDGSIIVSGRFAGNEGDPFSNLIVLDSSGRLIKRLPPLLYPHAPRIYEPYRPQYTRCNAALADGSFIVETELYLTTGSDVEIASRPMRLHSDGTVDESFDVRFGTNAPAYQAVAQSDGKLLFAGTFDGVPIRRTLPDGTSDLAFTEQVAMGGLPPVGLAMALGSGGKIWLWASENTFSASVDTNGLPETKPLLRLNRDGSRDLAFTPLAFTSVGSLATQSDGKVLVSWGGRLSYLNDTNRLVFARFNDDGSLDTTFNLNLKRDLLEADPDPFHTYLGAFAIMPSGNIAIALFREFVPGPRIQRLLSDGRIDPAFTDQLRRFTQELIPQSDGKLLVLHDDWPTAYSRQLARLNENGSVDSTFDLSAIGASYIDTAEIAVRGGRRGFHYSLEASTDFRTWATVSERGPFTFDPSENDLVLYDWDGGRSRQRFYRVVTWTP